MQSVTATVRATFLLGCLILAAGTAGAAETAATADPQKLVEPAKPVDSVKAPEPAKTTEPVKAAEPARTEKVVRLGYVDVAKIAADSDSGRATMAILKEKKDKLQAKVASREKQLEKQKSAIEAKIQTFTPQQREAKARDFQKKIEEYQKFVRGAEKEMATAEGELSQKLFQSIEKTSEAYGRDNGYTVIVIKKELLYLGKDVQTQDVTDDIIKILDGKQGK